MRGSSILLYLLLLAIGCSGSGRLVGKWEGSDGVSYEFHSDGSYVAKVGPMDVPGHYDLEGDTLKLTVAAAGEANAQTATVFEIGWTDRDKISLTPKDEQGKLHEDMKTVLRRSK